MSSYLGFFPKEQSDYYFISYNNEDADRVAAIIRRMHSQNISLWYDYGIPYGDQWETIIGNKLKDAKGVLLFITKAVMGKENSFVRKEYKIAEIYNIPIFVIILDEIHEKDIPPNKIMWWIDIQDRQNIDVVGIMDPDRATSKILSALPDSSVKTLEEKTEEEVIEAVEESEIEEESDSFFGKDISVGDTVLFGRYPQDKYGKVKTLIEWTVLDKTEGRMLLISKYILDCRQYNQKYEEITWENCDLRSWLNHKFYTKAFNVEERFQITLSTVKPDINPKSGTNPGNSTKDWIFLLSIEEAEKYFASDKERIGEATDRAKEKGVLVSQSSGSSWWWLRSPGLNVSDAAGVNRMGGLSLDGHYVNDHYEGVRPALWVDL